MNKIFNSLLMLLITVTFYFSCIAQTNRIENKLIGYDKFVETLLKEWKVPGAAIAVVKDGHTIYAKGFGYRDMSNKLQVTTKTLFGVGSITKTFLAASIGILQDEKKINIDTPIIRYIPDFKLYDYCMTQKMTIRDMLSHRSGLSGINWLLFPKDRKDITFRLRYEKPTKAFRESYQYNGTNFVVSANIQEQITGEKWEDYVRDKLFLPMEMPKSCFTYKNAQKIEDHSLAYYEKDGVIKETNISEFEEPLEAPAGLMFSNVEEMSNWMITFLNKGDFKGRRILSESYIDEMTKPNISHSLRPGIEELFAEYGLGLHMSSFQGNLIVYHLGNYCGFTAQMLMHPDSKTGIIILTNMDSPTGVNALAFKALEKILDLKETDLLGKCREVKKIYQDNDSRAKEENQKNRQSGAHPTLPLEKYIGTFTNEQYGTLGVISKNDTLKILIHGLKINLSPYRNDVFETDEKFNNDKISFMISNGQCDELLVDFSPAVECLHFKREKK